MFEKKTSSIFFIISIFIASCSNGQIQKTQNVHNNKMDHNTWHSVNLDTLNNLPLSKQFQLFEDKMVLLKNDSSFFPVDPAHDKTIFFSLNDDLDVFKEYLAYYNSGKIYFDFNSIRLDSTSIEPIKLIFIINTEQVIPEEFLNTIYALPSTVEKSAILFSSGQHILDTSFVNNFNAIVLAYENHEIAQQTVAQAIFGAKGFQGKLDSNLCYFSKNEGITLKSNGRLGFSCPEKFGIPFDSLLVIDRIAQLGIDERAYPGCQILVNVGGEIIYNKSLGNHTYDIKSKSVSNQDLYDLASITKIASSTLLTMNLHSNRKINLNNSISYYLPETKGTPYANVTLKSMMAHQAGFTAWIPFYRKTLIDGKLNTDIYSKRESNKYNLKVAEGIYMNKTYADSMYSWIYKTSLKSKSYRYSDLCFYFMKKILEEKKNSSLDLIVESEFYTPMGLQTMCYNPLKKFNKSRITPTENDLIYRNQLIHGYVHDQGAAMLGGVGGHAGLFSNAFDLAVIMQTFLNKGEYAGKKYIDEKTINEFTKQQYQGNRRGAGFDRPKTNGGGTCDESCSQKSFGHSGFTGTLAWADPENETVVIFLSNRVYPDAQNWKLVKMNTRTDIQREVNRLLRKYTN